MAPHSSTLAWKIPWMEETGRLQSMGSLRVGHDWATSLPTFHFHALEKEMATHSIVLAWRIPGMGEPGGLPSKGSHRVGQDWSDLAAATFPKPYLWGFPGGSVVMNLPANAGDAGLIPGSGRSPGGTNSNPLQYSCLGNLIDRASLAGYSPWCRKRVGDDWTTKSQALSEPTVSNQDDGWGWFSEQEGRFLLMEDGLPIC